MQRPRGGKSTAGSIEGRVIKSRGREGRRSSRSGRAARRRGARASCSANRTASRPGWCSANRTVTRSGWARRCLRAAGARWLVAPGTPPVLVPVRPARLDALADLVPGDGRAPGVVALADVEPMGGGSFDDAVRNAPVISSTTSAVPVTRAAPTASAAARRRFRCARASSGMTPVPVGRDMRGGTTHSAETYPVSWPAGPSPGLAGPGASRVTPVEAEGEAGSGSCGQLGQPAAAQPGGQLGELARVADPPGRVLGGQPGDQGVELRRDAGGQRRQRQVQVGGHHVGRGPVERRYPGQALVQHDAERVQVARRGFPGRRRSARRHVLRGAHDEARPGNRRLAGRVRDAEVGDLDLAFGADQDVARLDVPVHDAGLVRRGQPVRGLRTTSSATTGAMGSTARISASDGPSTNSITRYGGQPGPQGP